MVVLLGLGAWQLQRLDWKTEQIAIRQQALTGTPENLSANSNFRALDFHAVRADGRFVVGKSLFLYPRTMNKVAGVHILTPFKLDSGDVVIVNRGFVPSNGVAPKNFEDPATDTSFALTGILRSKFEKPFGVGDGIDKTGLIGWYDLASMAAAFDLDILPAVVEATNSPHPAKGPTPGQTITVMVNNHASYAFTWFSLALAWMVIFVVFWRQQGRT
jgi:surfeit locus 1 family protein